MRLSQWSALFYRSRFKRQTQSKRRAKNLRICFLSDPIYLHTQRWARFFLKKGHEVAIIGVHNDIPVLPDVSTFRLPVERFKGPWLLRTTLALKSLLKNLKPDILHMHCLDALVAPILLGFHPFVVSVWGADIIGETGLAVEDWRLRLFKKIVLRNADAVIALSRSLATSTCEYGGLPPDRVLTHYWGVDLKQFAAKERVRPSGENHPIVLGFVKHLLPKYGPEYFIRAVAKVRTRHPCIKALMIGDGPLRPDLESLSVALGIQDIVAFIGGVPHELVPRYMSQIDIFIMPSVYESETFGVAAAEAQAMGIPVVATRVGGIPEAVADGVTGLLVPPRDENAIGDAVMRLIEDRDLRDSMSRAGPAFVAQHFDWEKNAGSVEQLYYSLLSKLESRKL
jgi:glycosyltransferase involved in cell wall biosynthesis